MCVKNTSQFGDMSSQFHIQTTKGSFALLCNCSASSPQRPDPVAQFEIMKQAALTSDGLHNDMNGI